MPRGYRSRHRDTHEIILSVLYLGLGSRIWLQYYVILKSVAEVLCQKVDFTWSSWLLVLVERSCNALGRGLGSGTVYTACAIEHLYVRLAW